jgi:hypothetical protein
LRPCGLTPPGAHRASHRPAAPAGAGWRTASQRAPPSRADHAVPPGAAARGHQRQTTRSAQRWAGAARAQEAKRRGAAGSLPFYRTRSMPRRRGPSRSGTGNQYLLSLQLLTRNQEVSVRQKVFLQPYKYGATPWPTSCGQIEGVEYGDSQDNHHPDFHASVRCSCCFAIFSVPRHGLTLGHQRRTLAQNAL